MTEPLTPREWAERAFDGIKPDESLFAAVERVIGEAMAERAGALESALRSIADECANTGRGNEFVDARIIERVEEIAVEAIGNASGSG